MDGHLIGEDVDRLRVTVLAEDCAGHNTLCWAQNGLSLLLELTGKKTVLFDTGWSAEPILHNMDVLDKNPEAIDMVALSHCHRDHTGGLVPILKAINRQDVPLLAHPTIFRTQVASGAATDARLWLLRGLGLFGDNTLSNILTYGGRPVLLSSPSLLMPGLLWSGEIPRECSFEASVTIPVYSIAEGRLVADQILDDAALVVAVRGRGLVVLSGCCHAGIVNTLTYAKQVTGIDNICAVVGGLHLIDATEERIEQTVSALLRFDVEALYVGHCTGFRAEVALDSAFGDRFKRLHCGDTIDFAGQ